jgi:hypothetical protein
MNKLESTTASGASTVGSSALLGALRELHGRLNKMKDWREGCWEYDDDMGHPRRDFDDDEAWDMIEKEAERCAGKVQRLMQEMAPNS